MTPSIVPTSPRLAAVVAILAAIIWSFIPIRAFSETAVLPAVKDNTLYSHGHELSNGEGDFFFAGRDQNGGRKRGLLVFDVAGNIPDGAEITGTTIFRNSRGTMCAATSRPASVSPQADCSALISTREKSPNW